MSTPPKSVTVRWGRVCVAYLGFGIVFGLLLGAVISVLPITEEWRPCILGGAMGGGVVGFTIVLNRLLGDGRLRWLTRSPRNAS